MATPYPTPLATPLEYLSDAQLHTLLVQVQTLLLDRPPQAPQETALTVEVLSSDEAQLVALYRALPVSRRRELVARAASEARRDQWTPLCDARGASAN